MAPKRATRSNIAPETTNTTSVTNAQLQAMINQGVTAALAARDADRNTNGDDSHISGAGVRRTERTARECTYTDFLKCQPLNFKGTEGVAGLSQWFERMESVFHISNCTVENQVKFATCTLHSVALTWWNTHVKTVGHDAAYEPTTTTEQEAEHWQGLYYKDWSTATANNDNNQRGTGLGQNPTCYECGVQGHFKRECPKLKNNNNRGNQVGGGNAPAKVYAVGHAGTNPDSNVVMGTFLLNNRYASILFDTGVDKSFVSTAFSSQIDITSTALDHYYDYKAIIVCAKKIVRIPWGNETLIVHGDRRNRGNEAHLHIISYTKTQEYMLKGCPVFLANVTTKETEDKSKKKQLEDVPIVQDFPDVFPKDLSGLPPTRQVEFQIDLIPGAAPVARAPYRLAPSEMKELSEQLKELSDKGFIRPSSSPLGSSSLVCQKEGWIVLNVHRLSGTKQADNEESLSTPKHRRFV
ncbi:putative reverse transcriptase domain-containing protein [Tanacetum coccineum]|uniref:Reverse transcriptase domain-containing protein n=1 Tax=Tanacetum coccineum TaxID=301880 RepID=A0ABQ4YPT4_9ASTR